ncbi:SpaH/EbpB family LPXTG-anchored major pilin [Bifidobacterium mongoliense]|uniref:SpaH/EbpB family LPXTG-anchored major pilin n=1 Tax=Bifidobacterium mongoliense TaxID=518643 RepID=UPI0030EDB03D
MTSYSHTGRHRSILVKFVFAIIAAIAMLITGGVVAATHAPAAQAADGSMFNCQPGYIYSMQSNGNVNQIDPSGNVTTAYKASGQTSGSSYNGIGIGANGSTAYWYERGGYGWGGYGYRDSQVNKVVRYQAGTNPTAITGSGNTNMGSASLVAGAVDPVTGNFLIGKIKNKAVYLWAWTGNGFSALGSVKNLSLPDDGLNGDMAFDGAGNLYVVSSTNPDWTGSVSVNITLVKQSDIAAAVAANDQNRAIIGSNVFRKDIKAGSGFNGIAFDSNGYLYVGNDTTLLKYDPNTWGTPVKISNKMSSSTDLSSCSTPPTLTVAKNLPNGRAVPGDQFQLGIKDSAGTDVATPATTTGQASGVQPITAGPIPVIAGHQYTVTEAPGSASTDMANYVSSLACVDVANGNATIGVNAGKLSIPTGQAKAPNVVCTFTNTPKPSSATVNVHKLIKYYDQATPQPISGWTVGALGTATSGTLTQNPVSTTQQTNASGVASWGLNFNNANGVANVKVNEQQQANYKFDAGNALNQCKVTGSGASDTSISITSQDGVSVPSVKPRQTVDCTFVNVYTGMPTKEVADPTDGVVIGSTVPWTIKAPVQPDKPGDITKFVVSDKLDSRLSYKDLSVAGFTKDTDYTVDPASAANGNTVTVTFTAVGVAKLKAGDVVTLTLNTKVNSLGDGVIPNQATVFTNDNGGKTTSKPGEPGTNPTTNWGPLKVLKHAEGDVAKTLAGAEFTVYSDAAATTSVGTFTTGADGTGSIVLFVGNDSDTSQVYYLKETKAPTGYVLDDTVHTVTVNAGAVASAVAVDIANKQRTPPTLPLTGGMSTDAFVLGGVTLMMLSAGLAVALRRRMHTRV